MASAHAAEPLAGPWMVARMNRLPVATARHKRWVWLLCGVVVSGFGYTSVFIYVAIAITMEGIALGLFGERTSRRALETIAEEKVAAADGIIPRAV